ncbi:MAG: hypothetical protein ACLUD2_07295 [Clostridium sp.]
MPAEMPEEEELKTRLEAAREKLAVQQLQMKEKRFRSWYWWKAGEPPARGSGIRSIIQEY